MSTSAPRNYKGFTLIEMLVSVALFSVVVTIVAGAYLNLINLDRQTRATSDLVNNMTFVMNSMANNIRTGTNYLCIGGNTECTSMSFNDSSGCFTTYYYQNNAIMESQSGNDGNGNACTNTGQLTDANINITQMVFRVTGSVNTDYLQPQAMMRISGTINVGTNSSNSFTLQTTATERGIDLPPTP